MSEAGQGELPSQERITAALESLAALHLQRKNINLTIHNTSYHWQVYLIVEEWDVSMLRVQKVMAEGVGATITDALCLALERYHGGQARTI